MVETNSFKAIKLLDDKSGEGECFKELVAQIWKMKEKFQLQVLKNIHKEANKLVDSFAKHELSLQSHVCFDSSVPGFVAHSFKGDANVLNSNFNNV